jgi:membrane carboxypeptidase/penicillin-binding protein
MERSRKAARKSGPRTLDPITRVQDTHSIARRFPWRFLLTLKAVWTNRKRRRLRQIAAAIAAFPLVTTILVLFYINFGRSDLPDLDHFFRFEPPTIGRVYDAQGQVLIQLARERRQVIRYKDIPEVGSIRQPGSAMKPIVYLAAFRQGAFDLNTLVPDEPSSVVVARNRPLKWISNFDGEFKGMIPARQALAESRNAVAIWLAEQIGMASVLKTAQDLGIRTRLQPYSTTTLGASEVSLLELANAFRMMASGVLADPHLIDRIEHTRGAVVYRFESPCCARTTADSDCP